MKDTVVRGCRSSYGPDGRRVRPDWGGDTGECHKPHLIVPTNSRRAGFFKDRLTGKPVPFQPADLAKLTTPSLSAPCTCTRNDGQRSATPTVAGQERSRRGKDGAEQTKPAAGRENCGRTTADVTRRPPRLWTLPRSQRIRTSAVCSAGLLLDDRERYVRGWGDPNWKL